MCSIITFLNFTLKINKSIGSKGNQILKENNKNKNEETNK